MNAQIRFHEEAPNCPKINDLPHGGCCTLPADPGKLFMRIRTSHNKVQIIKRDANDCGQTMIKLLDIAAGEIGCYVPKTPCTPVQVSIDVYPTPK